MRGADAYNESLLSTVRLEDFVPATHPLRPIRQRINEALAKMDEKFSAKCEADVKGGRPSIFVFVESSNNAPAAQNLKSLRLYIDLCKKEDQTMELGHLPSRRPRPL
jgi:hypothetical protein